MSELDKRDIVQQIDDAAFELAKRLALIVFMEDVQLASEGKLSASTICAKQQSLRDNFGIDLQHRYCMPERKCVSVDRMRRTRSTLTRAQLVMSRKTEPC